MRRLQAAALLIGIICMIFVLIAPDLDNPVVFVKNHRAHVTNRVPSTIIGLCVAAFQQPGPRLFAFITHRYRFSSIHNHQLIELTCTRLC
jgi:hypothetical protein